MKSGSEKVLWIVLALVLLGILTAKVSWRLSDFPERRSTKQGQLVPTSQARLAQNYGKLPLSFELNKGQTDSQVKFLSRGHGYTMFLTQSEAVLSLRSGQSSAPRGISPQLPRTTDYGPRMADALLPPLIQNPKSQIQVPPAPSAQEPAPTTVRLKLVGANLRAKVVGLDPLPGRSNYFLGNDPKKWRTNVPTYAKVKYKGVYPGIDLIYYGNQGKLEYDFVVAPGGDPRTIALNIDGAEKMQIDPQGDLVLSNDGGDVRLHKPVVYQPVSVNPKSQIQNRKFLDGRFTLVAKNQVAFEVASYDRTLPLIIDPVLSYSTYLGGAGDDYAYGIAVDSSGNAYVIGCTNSINFPTIPGAFQTSYGGGNYDAFITKLNAAGSALVYSTYLGGSSEDGAFNGIAVDASGNAYVTGYTYSSNFPTTPGAFQTSGGGGTRDAFVAKLHVAGSALVYSTYLGGSDYDVAWDIAVDAAGNAYVTGQTHSSNFPTTPGAFQTSYGGGAYDAFITKLNAAGSALLYSTYLGGSDYDEGSGIAVDATGNAYVTGLTYYFNFPTTAGAFRTSPAGYYDAFVTKLNATGSGLVYSTYLGGGSYDAALGIAVDATGSAYVTGWTNSTNFPTTPGAFQTSPGGNYDAFITKLNAAGSALVYSTYLSRSSYDYGLGIAVDSSGNAYVTGRAWSSDFPTTPGAFQTSFGGVADAFVTKLNAAGSVLAYSTYLGGSYYDYGYGIAVDASGNAYVAGVTGSLGDFPTTPGAFQASYGGGGTYDVFVAKISFNQPPVANAGVDQTVECTSPAGCDVTLDGSASSDPDNDPLTYAWTGPFGTASGVSPAVTLPYGASTITLVVNDGKVDSSPDTVDITVQDTTPPALTLSSNSVTVVLPTAGAPGAPVNVLTASGASATDVCCESSVTLSPSGTGNYSIGSTTTYITASDCHSNTSEGKPFVVNVVYNFSGFLPPIRVDGSGIFRSGRTIPVKFQLTAADGSIVSNATATLLLAKVSGNVIGSFEEITPEAAGNSNLDNLFRFDPASGQYIYNLQATGFSAGTYVLRAHLNDGTDHDVYVSVR